MSTTTTDGDELATIRQRAFAAADAAGAVTWETTYGAREHARIWAEDDDTQPLAIVNGAGFKGGRAIAEHIVGMDPATTLDLLARIEAAETVVAAPVEHEQYGPTDDEAECCEDCLGCAADRLMVAGYAVTREPHDETCSRREQWETFEAMVAHPIFAPCFEAEGTLRDALMARLDALAAHDAEVAARTLRDAAQGISDAFPLLPGTDLSHERGLVAGISWLRRRADRIEKGETDGS